MRQIAFACALSCAFAEFAGAANITIQASDLLGSPIPIQNWGPTSTTTPNYSTYGQVFQTDSGNPTFTTLQTFRFHVFKSGTAGTDFDYKFYIYKWDGVDGLDLGPGGLVYQSPNPISFTGGFDGYLSFSVNQVLTPGQQYVAFLTSFNVDPTVGPTKGGAYLNDNSESSAYADGNYVFIRGDPFVSSGWSSDPSVDIVFDATLSNVSPVPEASHVLLAALGGLGLFAFARRRLFAAA